MSRFSVLVHKWYGRDGTETVGQILERIAGERLGEYKDIVADVVAMLEASGSLSGAQKINIATEIVAKLISKGFGVTLPASVIHFLIEEAVLLITGGNKSGGNVGEPPPSSGVDPSSIEYDSLNDAVSHVTSYYANVVEHPNGKFSVWPTIGLMPGDKLVYPPV